MIIGMLLIFVNLLLTCDADSRLYQQMETNRNNAVLSALQQLVKCRDNEQIQAISATLDQQMQLEGYVRILVHIIQSKEISQNILFAALTQLKNTLKFGHPNYTVITPNKKKMVVPQADLQFLLASIISMNQQHADNYVAFKLLKDIVENISEHLVQLAPTLHQMLLAGKGLKACLNILLGMANYFRIGFASEQAIFIGILKYIMPAIYELVLLGQRNLTALYWSWHQDQTNEALRMYNSEKEVFEEILYLAIKLVCKSTYNQIQFQQRQLYHKWAIIAQGRLEEQNEQYAKSNSINSCGKCGTHEYSYFHGKKWAVKYLIRFFPTILQCKKSKPDATKSTLQFLKEHGASLRETLRKVLYRDQPHALRILELSLLQTFMKQMPLQMRQQYEYYLFEILPKHAVLTSQQIHNLTQNPEQFFICEYARDSLRSYSTQIWRDFALSDSDQFKLNPKDQLHEGQLIVLAYQKMKEWLFDQNWEVKQIALAYLIKLSSDALFYAKSSVIAAELANLCLPNIFNQPLMILQVRGFELIKYLRKYIKLQTYPFLQEIILNVLRQREQQSGVKLDVLAVYAGIALDKVISYGYNHIRAFTDDEIKLILGNLLYLIKQYEIPDLNATLITMIQTYPKDMNCYAIELLKYLTITIRDIFSRAIENPASQLNQSAIETMAVIGILASLDSEDETFNTIFNNVFQQQISSLLQFALFAEDKINIEYIADLFGSLCSLINSKTNKVQHLSPKLSYFFTFLIFQLVPLDNRLLASLQQSNLTPDQKSLLQLSKNDLLPTQIFFCLFRNYLKFIDPSIPSFEKKNPQHNLFHSGILNQFNLLIDFYYKQASKHAKKNELYSILRGRYLVTTLLTYLLEHHQGNLPSQLYVTILQIIIVNGRKTRFKRQLQRKNIQLFCMWVYSYPNTYQCLNLFNQISLMSLFIKLSRQNFTLVMKQIYYSDPARKRIILGFCKMVQLSAVDIQIQNFYSMIVLWIFYMATQKINQIYGEESDQEEEAIAHRQQAPRYVNIEDFVFEQTQEQPERHIENDSLFEGNQDFDEEVNEEEGQGFPYKPLHTINELKYMLETMLLLRQIRPDYYYEQVMDQHKNILEHLFNLCSADLSSKYLCLLSK